MRRTRDKWETKNTVLCSKHFEPKCFKLSTNVAQSLGMKINAQLEPDAVPTLFDKPSLLKRARTEKDASGAPDVKKRKIVAPKSTAFTYKGIFKVMLIVSVSAFKENCNKKQAVTKKI